MCEGSNLKILTHPLLLQPKISLRKYARWVFFCFCWLLLIASNDVTAQKNKSQLEKEKEENLKKISETNKILEETKSKKDATIGQLTAIQQQINARNALINSISQEVEIMDRDIKKNESIMQAMDEDLAALKKEYADMIYVAYKSSNYYDNLTFLFSSKTFNQLYNRIQYFKQYSEARKSQLELIGKVTRYLTDQKEKISAKREEKSSLLQAQTNETKTLNELRSQQDLLVTQLSTKEKELKNELEDSKKSVKKLERLITDLIKAEREKEMKEAMATSANTASKTKGKKPTAKETVLSVDHVALTPEVKELSSSFAGNMGRLPWPVQHGSISHRFGKQPHAVLRGVYVENLGVDVQTLKNEPVRNVFKGKVITVASVPGMNNVVMVQHGEYFTVYAKLKTVSVVTGQEVKSKDILGEVYTDKNDVSELQFQIWKNNEKQDPERWLNSR